MDLKAVLKEKSQRALTWTARRAFEPPKDDQELTREQRDDSAAIKTYRYLRLGMIVIVTAMLSSLVLTARSAGCFQGSISAYYYTPTGPIFVAGLVAIGVSLVVIKGSTWIEDVFLMLAGLLAPIVAFVPTSVEKACGPDQPLERPMKPSIDAQLNNLRALLIAGVVAFVLAAIVLVAERSSLKRRSRQRAVAMLMVTAGVLVVAANMISTKGMLDQHGWAAVAMFAILALVSIYDGLRLVYLNRAGTKRTSKVWWLFAAAYIAVGLAMLAAGVVQLTVDKDRWFHKTLVVEMIEIGLFALIWSIQSFERWGRILQAPRNPTA